MLGWGFEFESFLTFSKPSRDAPRPPTKPHIRNAAYAPCQSPNNTLAKLKAPLFRRALVSEVDSMTVCANAAPRPPTKPRIGNAAYAPCQSPNNTLAKLKAPLFRRALVSEVDSVTVCANASFLGDSWAGLGGFLWMWGLGLTTVCAGNFVKEGLKLYLSVFPLIM